MKEMLGVLILVIVILIFSNDLLPKLNVVFDPQFYIAKPVTIRVHLPRTFNYTLPDPQKIYTEAPAKYEYITSSEDPLNDLETGRLDIVGEQRVEQQESRKNVRFVANVQESVLILMSPNQYPIQDISDLAKLLQPPIIKVNNKAAELVVRDILNEYPGVNSKDMKISTDVENPIMYAFLTVQPSTEISDLVKNSPMHVVTMNKINTGNYFVLETEKPFYRKHIHYEKTSFDMHTQGVKYYPGLSIRGQLMYYPTIKCKYAIYAHESFSDAAVERLLTYILKQKTMALTETAYNPDESIPTHTGARKIYQREKIYTKKPRPPIWQGF
jgi:hypothetical protein